MDILDHVSSVEETKRGNRQPQASALAAAFGEAKSIKDAIFKLEKNGLGQLRMISSERDTVIFATPDVNDAHTAELILSMHPDKEYRRLVPKILSDDQGTQHRVTVAVQIRGTKSRGAMKLLRPTGAPPTLLH